MALTPDRILDIGCGYRAAKVVLSAVELNVFSVLSDRPLGIDELMRQTGLHQRGARDFLDALVALGLLQRDDIERYANTPESELYLVRDRPTYIGGLFEQYNAREYGLWGSLTAGLLTGNPQTGITAARHFASLYAEPEKFRTFVKSMTAGSLLAAKAIAQNFPWADYQTLIDIGTAEGCLPVQVGLAHPHIRGGGFDLPELQGMFNDHVRENGLDGRLQFHAGNFFENPLPTADVLVLGRILHNWDIDTKKMLLGKAYDALPKGGALVVHETFISDDRRTDPAGLLASLNMLLWTVGGFDFSTAECMKWMQYAGFSGMWAKPLTANQSMVVGKKFR